MTSTDLATTGATDPREHGGASQFVTLADALSRRERAGGSVKAEDRVVPVAVLTLAVDVAVGVCKAAEHDPTRRYAFDAADVRVRFDANGGVAAAHLKPRADSGRNQDVFLRSLGLLLLRIANEAELEGTTDEELFRLWIAAPAVAEVVDELTDPAAPGWAACNARGVELDGPIEDVLDAVADKLEDQLRFTTQMRAAVVRFLPVGKHDRRLLMTWQSSLFSAVTVRRMWAAFRLETDNDPTAARETAVLRLGAAFSALAFYVAVFVLFIPLTVADFQVVWDPFKDFPLFGGLSSFYRDIGLAGTDDPLAPLAGRVVALSFSFIAITYYFNLFATLNASGVVLTRRMSLSVRLLPFTLNVPIFIGLLWPTSFLFFDPAWPWVAALGMLVPTVNNALCVDVVDEAQRRADPTGKGSGAFRSVGEKDRSADFSDHFREWRNLMLVYVGFLIVIAGLFSIRIDLPGEWFNRASDVRLAPLADEWLFVFLIAVGGNTIKLYGSNVRKRGPYVAGHLARVVFLARRLERESGVQRLPTWSHRLGERLVTVGHRLSGRDAGPIGSPPDEVRAVGRTVP